MCGITGAVWFDQHAAIEPDVLARMTDVLRHRGPDDAGSYASAYRLQPPYGAMPGVALGHRRLSIIDLAGGHQPLANEDESIWIVFNGEIYNHRELRHRLEGAGHRFRTHSDTEAIVHLYEDTGLSFVDHLNGMFALAIWDAHERRLVLARDRLGEKPFYYRHDPGRLLFASELKSLLEVPGILRQVRSGKRSMSSSPINTFRIPARSSKVFPSCRLPTWPSIADDRLSIGAIGTPTSIARSIGPAPITPPSCASWSPRPCACGSRPMCRWARFSRAESIRRSSSL